MTENNLDKPKREGVIPKEIKYPKKLRLYVTMKNINETNNINFVRRKMLKQLVLGLYKVVL